MCVCVCVCVCVYVCVCVVMSRIDFTIEDLTDCDVYIMDYSAQVQMDYCSKTRVVMGPVNGSFFMRNCKGCRVAVCCQQFRARDCIDCHIFLYATTAPVIEASNGMRFSPWNVQYPGLTQQFAIVKWDKPSVPANKWNEIFDFHKDDYSQLPASYLSPRCVAITESLPHFEW